MSAKSTFDAAIERSEYYLHLYDLLHSTGKRRAKSPWLKKIKDTLNWQQGDKVARIPTKHGLIITRNSEFFAEKHFQHEFLSELLRSAIVSAISALDKYVHNLIIDKSWQLLGLAEDKVPTKLKEVSISIYEAKKAVSRLKSQPSARPGNQLKLALQEVLYRDSLQGKNSISKSAKILNIRDFWNGIAREMDYEYSSEETQCMIDEITQRRNKIVHEADLKRKIKKRGDTLHAISRSDAQWYVEFVRDFADAFDVLANEA